MDYINSFDNSVNSTFEQYLTKPTIVRAAIHLLLVLYIVQLAPVPPPQVLVLFTNVYFKIAMFVLVLWTAQFSPSISILVALAFMATINYSTRGKFGINGIYEMLDNVPATPVNSLQAVQQLTSMASSPTPVPASIVTPITNMILTNVTTPDAISAVQSLSNQAMASTAGDPAKIASLTQIVASNISASMPSPSQAIQAVNTLANAAVQPSAIPTSTIIPIANAAMSGVSTPIAASAVQSLVNQATAPSAGTPTNISSAVQTALTNISDNSQSHGSAHSSTTIATANNATQAVQSLANAAASPSAAPISAVTPIANIAASGVSTPVGLAAVQALATQASTASPGTIANVTAAVQTATADIHKTAESKAKDSSMPIPTYDNESGCYPVRNYDMSKVTGLQDGKKTFENWQTFKPSITSS